ncbi:MAG: Fe-S cluster assembly protein SufB [Akkermansia sp.]|nr:Fe-S cluster assembly protein SufB [Akkermansia sp.]
MADLPFQPDTRGEFSFPENHKYDAGYGLTEATIDYICDAKGEPDWLRRFRKDALKKFHELPMPYHWAPEGIRDVDFDQIRYYLSHGVPPRKSWDDVPDDVKRTFERLGVPEQERAFLAGVDAQYDSETAYNNMREELSKQGVIFVNSTEGLKEHEDVFRPWFGKVIPVGDNKFSALNHAAFSGGSFIYVPKGVKLKQPLQAYFRINSESMGQFERTLIIADEGAELMYMEGCTAPKFDSATLHSGVVELVALKGAKIQYVTVQNWATNVYNLVIQRGLAMEDAEIRWIDCNLGSKLTMKYPAVVLQGRRARGEVVSISLAHDGQDQDTGARMIHAAPETTSNIVAKSISIGKGRASYRGEVNVLKGMKGCRNNTECDALLISAESRTDTYPAITVNGNSCAVQHEASVSQVDEEMLFYMQQRGLTRAQAMSLAVNGFINDLVNEFPMEYSVELRRLIDLEMEDSIG